MGKKIVVSCFDVIMIQLFPEKCTVKDHSHFYGMSTILIVSLFSRYLESVSDFFLLLIGCTGSLSVGAFLLSVTISRSQPFSERARDEDDCQQVFQI